MDTKQVQLTDEIIEALDDELAYQNAMSGTERADNGEHGVPGQILIMEDYLSFARVTWVHNKDDTDALHVIRKVVATGIRALAIYGCPKRVKQHVPITPETCDCNDSVGGMCPVCNGGLEICAVCGMAEIELDETPICPGGKE